MKKVFIIGFVLALGLQSCSDFNEVVKSDDYARKFEVANQLFEEGSKPMLKRNGQPKLRSNGEYKLKTNTLLHSVTLYEQIYQRMPKTPEGELAYFRIGKAYYLAGDYYMGGYYLGVFPKRFPFSTKAEESLFLSAMCSVQNSPETSLDQNETELAINDLQTFIDQFPNSILVDSCNRIIDKLYGKLELKDYQTVKLYDKTERFHAAVTSAETYLEDHPMSSYDEEVSYLLVKNSYLLAKNSIDSKKKERIEQTIERYRNFAARFPVSTHLRELERFEEEMKEELADINNSGI
jgi:outer membrane protein assembly factor BamD